MEYLYAKFAKDEPYKRRRFKISTQKDQVENWKSTDKKPSKKPLNTEKNNISESKFYKINQEIFDTFIALYDTVPILLGISSIYPNVVLEEEIITVFKSDGDTVYEDDDYQFFRIELDKSDKIFESLKKIKSSSSIFPNFPRFYIVGLISLYDHFVHNLARDVIDAKPEIVFNSEKNISFSDINKFKDMDEVKAHIVAKELENLLRDSHEEQLLWFSKKLGMKITPEKELYASFVELCERRNLFTHTGGYVTAQYLTKCEFAGCDLSGVNIGDKLEAGSKYFKKSVETIIELSVQLVQVVWQKIEKEGGKEASKSLINITYNLIKDEKYELSIRILNFILGNKLSSMDDSTRKMHVINCANAMKLAGKKGYMERVNAEDWSASTHDFQLCVAAIRDDVPDAIRLLERAAKAGSVSRQDVRDWPVFKALRRDEKFVEAFEKLFEEPIFLRG